LILQNLEGLVILDEIQRLPEVFPILRVLADRRRPATRFLILGSASPALLKQSSESLAGRIAYYELQGFSVDEVGIENLNRLWVRGSYPRSYLAASHKASSAWRRNLIKTFLERDVSELGFAVASTTLHRFWSMLTHYHGQTWNYSEFARSFGVSDHAIRNYLDILTAMYVVRVLPAYHENISKRQVKAPKVYLSDSGLLHTLLNLESQRDIEMHPKLGASWEGFGIEVVLRLAQLRRDECFYWATYTGAELDLLTIRGRQRWGFEFKRTVSPRMTKSMRYALTDLGLSRLYVIHAGEHTFPLEKKVTAVALRDVTTHIKPMR
jgi:predicted AAA+ superfamily ATPase